MVQKVAVKPEFEAGLHHATTGKLSLLNLLLSDFIFPAALSTKRA